MNQGKEGGDESQVVEIRARTVDEAVARGLVRLGGLSRSEVKIEVVSEPRGGVLGLGSGDAVVRLTVFAPGDLSPESAGAARGEGEGGQPGSEGAGRSRGKSRGGSGSRRVSEGGAEVAESDVEVGVATAAGESDAGGARGTRTPGGPRRESGEGLATAVREPAKVVAPAEAEDAALEVTRKLVAGLGYEGARVERTEVWLPEEMADDKSLIVGVTGGGSERLLADDAEGLMALQFVARLILARKLSGWVNLLIDVDGDRGRRIKELVQLARQSADLVEREGRPVSLPPMSPYERRVVHMVPAGHPVVATHRIGTGLTVTEPVGRLGQLLPEL